MQRPSSLELYLSIELILLTIVLDLSVLLCMEQQFLACLDSRVSITRPDR